MIKVTYHRRYYRVTIEGHAKSGEMGHDLVCASASILAYTLAANVINSKSAGYLRNGLTKMEAGDTEIKCMPRSRYKSTMMMIFDTVCTGFELLAHDYPENISYEIRG